MATTKANAPFKSPWHAVSLVGDAHACNAVVLIRARRFLPSEAPRFPLDDCTMPSRCQCVYRHYADRRAGPRLAGAHRMPAGGDRRRGRRGRRATD
jgi:hypothetical protein